MEFGNSWLEFFLHLCEHSIRNSTQSKHYKIQTAIKITTENDVRIKRLTPVENSRLNSPSL